MAEGGEPSKITAEEKLKKALEYKLQGNEFYQKGNVKAAVGKYHRALLYLKGIEGGLQGMTLSFLQPIATEAACSLSEENQAQTEKLKLACYNNLAACLLMMENPNLEKVVSHCDEVLKLAPRNAKALYRKGKALLRLGDLDAAQDALTKAARLPEGISDAKVKDLLQECNKRLAVEDKKLKQTYKNMFEQLSMEEKYTIDETISPTKEEEDLPADES